MSGLRRCWDAMRWWDRRDFPWSNPITAFETCPCHVYSYLLDQPKRSKNVSPPRPLPVPKCCQNKLISSRPPIFIEFLYLPGNYKEHIPTIESHKKSSSIASDYYRWTSHGLEPPLFHQAVGHRSPVAHARSPQTWVVGMELVKMLEIDFNKNVEYPDLKKMFINYKP